MYIDSTFGSNALGYLRTAWNYRHLCLHLVGSDLRARFRRTYLGMIWAILVPLGFALAFATLLSGVFKQPWQDFVIYIYIGLTIWEFIASSASRGAESFIEASGYIRQSRIPMIIFPIRVVLTSLIYFMISSFGFVILALIVKSEILSVFWLYYPIILSLLIIFCIPVAIICSFINVIFRDFGQILTLFLQFNMMISPVFIAKSVFSTGVFLTYSQISPLFAILEIAREPLLYGHHMPVHAVLVLLLWSAMFLVVAILLARSIDNKIVYYL